MFPQFLHLQAASLVQSYDLEALIRPGLEASEEHIVEFADLALDCLKSPGTRRPEMHDVARRLATLLAALTSSGREAEEEWKEESEFKNLEEELRELELR